MSSQDLAPEIANAREAFALIGGDAIERQIFLCAMSEKQSCCTGSTPRPIPGRRFPARQGRSAGSR